MMLKFNQNRFINICAKENLPKISERYVEELTILIIHSNVKK